MKANSVELFKGDNRMLRVFVKDENLDIIDLNGAEARFFLAESSQSGEYIFKKTTLNYQEGVIRTPELGEVVFFINTDDTKELDPTQYYYQIIIILKNGQRYTVANGVFNLRNNIEYGEVIPSVAEAFLLDVPQGSNYVEITVADLELITPVLLAPSATAENVWITNVLYPNGIARIYFSSQIQEAGWRISYTISRIG